MPTELKTWRHTWTDEEQQTLRDRYPKEGASEDLCRILNRKPGAIAKKAQKWGVQTQVARNRNFWTKEQEEILKKEYYSHGPDLYLQTALDKTAYSIKMRACKLGIHKVYWTEDQLELLKKHYPHEGATDFLSIKLNKGKAAIFEMAKKLCIPFGDKPLPWTEEAIDLLRREYPIVGASKKLQFIFKRSAPAIRAKARTLGVKTDPTLRGSHKKNGFGDVSGTYVCTLRKGARERGFAFEIDAEYMWRLFQKQEGKCALSCLDISVVKDCTRRKMSNQTASLDRIDPLKGYVDGNLQWVHRDINWLKTNFSQEQFLRLCNQVAQCHPISVSDSHPVLVSSEEMRVFKDEEFVLKLLADAWNAWIQLPDHHPSALSEFCSIIHAAQGQVAMRITRKAKPDFWWSTPPSSL